MMALDALGRKEDARAAAEALLRNSAGRCAIRRVPPGGGDDRGKGAVVRFPSGIGIAALLVMVVLAAHSGALNGGFHYDDLSAVVQNPAIRTWQPIRYLTSPAAASGEVGVAGYRPLTVATFALNYLVGGLDPGGYLALNLALHALVSWMVFVVGRRLFEDSRWAALAAVVYAVHPVNAEAVNYVVARSSLLAVLGSLTAFWAFLRWREDAGLRWLVVALGAFAAALLGKESAIALIVPLAAYEIGATHASPLSGREASDRGRARRLFPFFLIVVLAYLALWWGVAGRGMSAPGRAAYPAWAFLELCGRSLWLWMWPWPLGLDHPLTFARSFDGLLAAKLVVAVAAVLALVAWCRRRAPLVSWSLVWTAAGFAPLLPLAWMTTRGLLQEHRLAFSAVALAWLTAIAARALVGSPLALRRRALRQTAALIGVAAFLAALAVDRTRSAVWNDDLRVWEEAVRLSPENLVARINLGVAYRDRNDFDRAETEFRKVAASAPSSPVPYYHLGVIALERDRLGESEGLLHKATALDPGAWRPHHALGELAMRREQYGAAAEALRRALALNPRDTEARMMLGLLAQQTGNFESAEAEYRLALQDAPGDPRVMNNLGALYLDRGQPALASSYFADALQHDPGYVEAAYNHALALEALGKTTEARSELAALLSQVSSDPSLERYRRAVEERLGRGSP